MVAAGWDSREGSGGSLNVMVSDIRDQYADALQILLEPHGFTIHRVESGDEAIWLVKQRPIDAAVLDQDLPDMSGMAVMRMLRTLDQLMPIILVGRPAGSSDQEHLLRSALELEAFSVLAQPVDLEVVLGQMARVFERFVRNLHMDLQLGIEGLGGEAGNSGSDVEPTRQPGRGHSEGDTLRFKNGNE